MEILTEQYILMHKPTVDSDYELCFDEAGKQIVTDNLKMAQVLKDEHQESFDLPLVIVRETQTIVG